MYIVIEMQTTGETVGTLTYQFSNLSQAEAKYHSILAVAATSGLYVHAAILMNNHGGIIKSEFYEAESI